jgi:phosphoribosylanthranilate isomerase
MKIKVCGMRESQNISDLVSLEIDYLGFIFYEQSPRFVGLTPPQWVEDEQWGKTQKVGVFVNHSIDFMTAMIERFDLGLVQLHGDESVELCSALRKIVCDDTNNSIDTHDWQGRSIKIIKVFAVGEDFDFTQLNDYKPFVDYFLFDTKGKNLGGNGVTFDWKILENYDNEKPFFLSGGIDIQHIEEIKQLKNLNIHALDINSKFEVSAGVKDVEKIKKFATFVSDFQK